MKGVKRYIKTILFFQKKQFLEHIGSFDPEITCRNSSVSKDFFKTLHIERGQQLDKTYITATQWTDFYIKATLG